jgi:cytochrome P450
MPRRAELRRQRDISRLWGGELIVVTDPPRHSQLRKLITSAFTPRMVASLEKEIHDLTIQILDKIEQGTVGDLVELVAQPIPMYVIAKLLGVPAKDFAAFGRWTDAAIAATDALEDRNSDQLAYFSQQLMELFTYFSQALDDRRANPRDDLLSALAHAEVDGEQLSEVNQVVMTFALLIGGNETTRGLISGAAKLLAEHPDQRAKVLEQPELIPTAIDECLRYLTPAVTMARTAMSDTEIRGQPIKRGDYIVMLWAAGNRDEDIWQQPEVFDVTRKPNPHLAFGFGQHACVGAALTRLETSIVLREFLARFPDYEIAGEVDRTLTNMTPGICAMPVLFK